MKRHITMYTCDWCQWRHGGEPAEDEGPWCDLQRQGWVKRGKEHVCEDCNKIGTSPPRVIFKK